MAVPFVSAGNVIVPLEPKAGATETHIKVSVFYLAGVGIAVQARPARVSDGVIRETLGTDATAMEIVVDRTNRLNRKKLASTLEGVRLDILAREGAVWAMVEDAAARISRTIVNPS